MAKLTWANLILSIRDKDTYCRKLLYEIYHQEDEFTERRFYELCFALYARFFDEHLSPLLLVDYFKALAAVFENHYLVEINPEIAKVLALGLSLENYANYSEDNFQLTNIMLQLNNVITRWQNRSHICKFCGHKLNLLTQTVDGKRQQKFS